MPRKGMRTIFFKPSPASSPMRSPPHRHTFSDTMMDENIENAQLLISKWDPDSSSPSSSNYCNITSLFSDENRFEAKQYLNSVKELQSAMQHYIKLENYDP